MTDPVHTYPMGGTMADHEDLAHDYNVRAGEQVIWTRTRKMENCILCQEGACTQKVVTGPAYRVPHVLHGLVWS